MKNWFSGKKLPGSGINVRGVRFKVLGVSKQTLTVLHQLLKQQRQPVEIDQWREVNGAGPGPGQVAGDVGPRFHKYNTDCYHLKANGCYKRMGVSDYRKFAGSTFLSRPNSASYQPRTSPSDLQRLIFRFLR